MEYSSLIVTTQNAYDDSYVVNDTIRYITRTREKDKNSSDILCYGAVGLSSNPDKMIEQMKITQNLNGIDKKGGRRIYQEIYGLGKLKNPNISEINKFARECAKEYYSQGHQVAYGVHQKLDGSAHIHFIVNTINHNTHRKLHDYFGNRSDRENRFNSIRTMYKFEGRKNE